MIDPLQISFQRPAQIPTIQLTLLPVRSSDHVCAISLAEGLLTIGSGDNCNLRLNVAGIEPQHCRIQVEGESATLVAESRMTWLNDGPVRRQQLKDGDRLAVGPVEFAVQIRRVARNASALDRTSDCGDDGDGNDPGETPCGIITTESIEELLTSSAARRTRGVAPPIDSDPEPASGTPPAQHPTESSQTCLETDERQMTNGPWKTSALTTRALQKSRENVAGHETKLVEMEQALVELDQQRSHIQTVLDDLLSEATTAVETRHREDHQLRRRRDELSRLENETNLWQATLRERQTQTDLRHAELQQRTETLHEDESRVDAQRGELDQTNEALAEARRDLYEREQALQSRAEEFNETEAALADREQAVRHESDALDQRSDELTQRAEELDALQTKLEQQRQEREAATEDWSAERSAFEVEASRLRDEVVGRKEQQAELQRQLDARTSDLRDALERIDSQQASHDDEQTRLAEWAVREAEVERLKSEVEEQLRTSAQRETELNEQQRTLEAREAELTRQTEQRIQRERELDERQCERDELSETAAIGDDAPPQKQWAAMAEIAVSRAELDRHREKFGAKFEQLTNDRRALREDQQACDLLRTNLLLREQELETNDRQRQQRLDDLETEHRHMLETLETRQAECDELRTAQQQLTDERTTLAEEVDELRRQLDLIREEAELQTSDPRQRLEELEADYRQSLAGQEELRNERDELRSRQADVELERSELQQQLESLRNELQSAQREQVANQAHRRDEERPSDQAAVNRQTQDHVLENDAFELTDDDRPDEACDQEAYDDEADDEQEVEPALSLRSQMAEMFGIGAEALTSAARRVPQKPILDDVEPSVPVEAGHPHDVEPADESAVDEAPTVASAPTSHLDADDPDSVAAYMRNLLARNRGGRDEPSPVAPSAPQPKPTPVAPSVAKTDAGSLPKSFQAPESNADDETTPVAATSTADTSDVLRAGHDVDVEPDSSTPARPKPNVDLERQHFDSFRELANRSARSAVAKHNSTALKNTLLIQAIVGTTCLAATIVLLSSPFWSPESYATWGTLTSLLTVLMAWKLLETHSRMRGNRIDHKPEEPQTPPVIASDAGTVAETADSQIVDDRLSEDSEPEAIRQDAPPESPADEHQHIAAAEESPPKQNRNMPTLAFDDVIPI